MDRRAALSLAAVVVGGVVLTGVVDFLLATVYGRVDLARIAWVVGYGATVLVAWWGWIRPLDLTGPDG